jgi:hypothetical protein
VSSAAALASDRPHVFLHAAEHFQLTRYPLSKAARSGITG